MTSKGMEEMLFDSSSPHETWDNNWSLDESAHSADESIMLDVSYHDGFESCSENDAEFDYECSTVTDDMLLMQDEVPLSQRFGPPKKANPEKKDKVWVADCIEEMMRSVLDALANDQTQLSISLKMMSGASRRNQYSSKATNATPVHRDRKITFPGRTSDESWRFMLMRILEIIHEALMDDVTITKRDIYYHHPDLFVKQSFVDQYVDDLARTFGVSRHLLNVVAAAKGLFAGNFEILKAEGDVLNGMTEEGLLIPEITEHDRLDLSHVCWVLIIEKEATFRSLVGSAWWANIRSRGLIMTAKGYPDLASRNFLQQVARHYPNIPAYILVDHDPDGIAIMSTYKYSSCRFAHENTTTEGNPVQNVPQIRWLGLRFHQIAPMTSKPKDTDIGLMANATSLMRLTARDRKKATQMLEWSLCAENGPEQDWRRELQQMLALNVKAEMQILEELPGGTAQWLSINLEPGMTAEGIEK